MAWLLYHSNMTDPMLNIQQISSRTWVADPSMDTSIEHIEHADRNSSFNRSRDSHERVHQANATSIVVPQLEEMIQYQKKELEHKSKLINSYVAHLQSLDKSTVSKSGHETSLQEMSRLMLEKDAHYDELRRKYQQAIVSLKDTLTKNEILAREIERLSRKLKESELNYSRDKEAFNRSQHIISNLSVTKSNYEIELVNMQDSLVIMDKQKREAERSKDNYQQKLALLSQELERLRMLADKNGGELSSVHNAKQRLETEVRDLKESLMRYQKNEQLITSKLAEYTEQLRIYHEKLSSKETMIGEYREKETVLENTVRLRQGELRELQSRLEQVEQTGRLEQQGHSQSIGEYTQEVARLREIGSELSSKLQQASTDRDKWHEEYENLLQHYEKLKEKHEELILHWEKQKDNLEELTESRQQMVRDREEIAQALQKVQDERKQSQLELQELQQANSQLRAQIQRKQSEFEQLSQQASSEARRWREMAEQKEKKAIAQFKQHIERQNQQQSQQLVNKINELNKIKYELSAKTSELSQAQGEVAKLRGNLDMMEKELASTRKETIEQSTIIDTSRKSYQDQLRKKNEFISELQSRLQSTERVVEETRREKELLTQDKNEILVKTHQSQQIIRLKSGELEAGQQQIDQLRNQLEETRQAVSRKEAELGGYRRVTADHERVVQELEQRINEDQRRMMEMTHEITRLGEVVKEREARIEENLRRERQFREVMEEKRVEILSMQQNVDRLTVALNQGEQSRGSFKVLMGQIDRLNQQLATKQSQNSSLREEVLKLAGRIESIGRQQGRIMQLLQSSEVSQGRRNQDISEGLGQIRQQIARASQSSLTAINRSTEHNQRVWKEVESWKNEDSGAVVELRHKLTETQQLLGRRSQELTVALAERDSLRVRLQQTETEAVRQQQVLQKLLEMSRQNAVLRQKVVTLQNQLDGQAHVKQQELQSASNSYLHQLHQLQAQIDRLNSQLRQRELQILNLQANLSQAGHELTLKNQHLHQLEAENSRIISQLRQIQAHKQSSNSTTRLLEEQNLKLQAIIEFKSEQLSENQRRYKKLKESRRQMEHSVVRTRQENNRKQLEKERAEEQQRLRALNGNLEEEIRSIYFKLREKEQQVQSAQTHIQQLQQQLQGHFQSNSHLEQQVAELERTTKAYHQVREKNLALQEELERTVGQLNELKIQCEFLRGNHAQSAATLHAFEQKLAQVVRQYEQLEQVMKGIRVANSTLESKNHHLQVELKKAEVLQDKIQVLNGEINRLSLENIGLNQQLSGCRLTIGDGSTMERRFEEQMAVMVLLMAEVDSLRQRQSRN